VSVEYKQKFGFPVILVVVSEGGGEITGNIVNKNRPTKRTVTQALILTGINLMLSDSVSPAHY